MEQDDIDVAQLKDVSTEVHRIIDAEAAALGGDTRRVGIGGNSQGSTLAMHAAMTYAGGPLGGVFMGCGLLLDVTPVDSSRSSTPIFVFTAEHDQEYLPALQRRSYARLRDAGYGVSSHVDPGLDHYTDSTAELHHTAAWIARALHGQTDERRLAVAYRDVPSAPGPVPPLFEGGGAGSDSDGGCAERADVIS